MEWKFIKYKQVKKEVKGVVLLVRNLLKNCLKPLATWTLWKGKQGAGVVICRDAKLRTKVSLAEKDRYMHLMVIGPTGCGKTMGTLNPMAMQDLQNSAVGLTIIEPKGDWVGAEEGELYKMALELGRKVAVLDPASNRSWIFNPLAGPAEFVAEANRMALQVLFGSQEAFFDKNQGLVLKKVILLLKGLYQDNLNYLDLARNLRDAEELKRNVALAAQQGQESLVPLIQWFGHEYFGPYHQDYLKFTIGLRVQVEEMLTNAYFRSCIIPLPGQRVVDLDQHLAEGGVLLVSTNDGLLGSLSPVLGRLILTSLQFAIARRKGTGKPHFVYVDEFATYANRSFGTFLTKARAYNCGFILALQSLGQLNLVDGQVDKGFRETILGQCRSKIIYGGLEREDVEYFSGSFGYREEVVLSRSTGEMREGEGFFPTRTSRGETVQKGVRPYLDFNTIRYLPRNKLIYELTVNRSLQMPRLGYVMALKERKKGKVTMVEKALGLVSEPASEMEQGMSPFIQKQADCWRQEDLDGLG